MPEANKVAPGQAASGSQLLRDLASKKVTLRHWPVSLPLSNQPILCKVFVEHVFKLVCGAAAEPTLQGEVDKALALVFRSSIRTVGASRTDSGVHAQGQVCHFEAPSVWANSNSRLDAAAALRRLRLTLPKAILALELGLAPSGFHSRLSALKKQYSYRLSTESLVMPFEARRCWICGDLNLDAMQKAVDELSGKEMDYSAFSTGENDPDYHGPMVKTVDISLQVDGPDKIFIRAESERFLYKMVRRLVGGLVEVGKGRFKDKEAERKALKLCRDALLGGPIEEDETEEGVQRGARGTIGEGSKQRPFRLDTDEPDTAERLSKLAREVRQADLSASCRHMNFRSKLERHEVEMTELYKQRLTLPLDITDLPLQEPRSLAKEVSAGHREACFAWLTARLHLDNVLCPCAVGESVQPSGGRNNIGSTSQSKKGIAQADDLRSHHLLAAFCIGW
eukprot:s1605_g8.t4